jgi:hypothetical protein
MVMYRSMFRDVKVGLWKRLMGVGSAVVIGLQMGVKKCPLCSILLRTSLTRITSSMAGVRIELESRSIGLHERLSNLFSEF